MSLIPFILDLADELHEFSRCLANGIDINDFGFGLYTGTDQQQPQQHQQQPQQQQQQQQPQTSPRRSRTSSFSSFWMPSKRHHPYNRIKTACCAKSGEETVAVTPEKSDAGSSSIGGTPGKSASYSVVNKNGFQVSMNVKQFAPNELSVKTIDNCIVVEGRHDDKEDGHGVISRHFVRKYMLPKGYDPNDVLSTLSSDGILTVKAPPPPPPTAKNDEPNERIIEIQPTPGPTPVLVVSAKDTPAKETSKKLATTPSARLECQLPEKRQKLDLPPEPEPEESAETPAPIPPATATVTETESASASVAVAGTEVESNDVEMEKSDEQINEVLLKQTEQQQQTSDVGGPENEVEKKAEIIEQKEKEQKQKQGKIETETEKKLLDECMSDSNGDSKIAAEKMEESSSVTEATEEDTEKTNETPAAAKVEASAEESNVTKMEVDDDGDNDGHDDVEEKTDNTEVVVATIKTADSETKTAVKAAAGADSAKKNTDKEKTNNTDTSSSSSNTSTTTTTTTTNNNNNTSTNSNSTTTTTITNNSSTESVTENSANDVKGGNGVVTGDIPVDIPKTTDSDAANTATAKTKATADSSKAESVAEGEHDIETAVLGTDTTTTTKNIIDDVALLKAATADPADITDNAEENVILTESMDGITTTTNTNTTTTTVDNVECSLFAKKSHLGNGSNTTATPLVGTEEMAN